MSLSKLSKNKPAAAAPVEATPVVEDTALALIPETTHAVSIGAVLDAALSTESSRANNSFATVNLTGGPSGGMFAPADYLPQEVQDALPSGKKPIPGVLMGYRLAVSAWPVGYTDAPTGKDAKPSKPVYSASVSANDASLMPLALKAARNYQFTKAADKSKFDYATSSAGHIRVAVELLVYCAELGQPIVISSPANFGAVEATLQNIQTHVDKATGGLGQFPCEVRAVTEDKASKSGFTWKQHHLDITKTAGTTSAVNERTSYEAWKAEAMKDAGVVQSVRDWIGAVDRKATPDVVAALKAAAAL